MPETTTTDQPSRLRRLWHWISGTSGELVGSDAFFDCPSTYVWQANQVGHFGLGFAAASIVAWALLAFFFDRDDPSLDEWLFCLGLVVIGAYVAKELFGDLRIAKAQAEGCWIPSNKRELWEDIAADSCFVALGVFTVVAAHRHALWGLAMAAVSVGVFLVLKSHFLPPRESFDRAALPYMFRLCNFPKTQGVRSHNVDRVRAFIENKPVEGFAPSQAVLIQGFRECGKTMLAIGIGTEAAMTKRANGGEYQKVLYFTAFGLLEREVPTPGGTPPCKMMRRRMTRILGAPNLHKFADADLIIIDDVDSDNPVYGRTPEQIVNYIKSKDGLCAALRSKRTVWVTGNSRFAEPKEKEEDNWVQWLRALCDLYGLEDVPSTGSQEGASATEIMRREPIPVIWLTQRLEVEDVNAVPRQQTSGLEAPYPQAQQAAPPPEPGVAAGGGELGIKGSGDERRQYTAS